MRYFSKFIVQFVSFFLVFTIGFLSCIAVVVGAGAYIYGNVSIDKLNEFGMGIDTGNYFDPNAEVPVNSITLQKLLEEILGVAGETDEYSLNDLINRYGLLLPDEVTKYLPSDAIMDAAIGKLFSSEGLDILLHNTPLNYLLQFIPEGVLGDEVGETIGTKSLYEIIFPESGDYSAFLQGVQLGFFLGVDYEKTEEGEYVVRHRNPEAPTLFELLAPIDLGVVLGIFTAGGSVQTAIYKCLGHIRFNDIIRFFVDPSVIKTDRILADKGIGSFFREIGHSGEYELYIPGVFEHMYLATIFGVDGQAVNGRFVVEYQNPDSPTFLELLAPFNLGAIAAAIFDDGDVMGAFYADLKDIAFNDLFGTVLNLERLGLDDVFADKTIGDFLRYQDGQVSLYVPALTEDLYLGAFFNVDAHFDEDGNYVVVYRDPENPTIFELLASVHVGGLVDAIFNGGSLLVTLYESFDQIKLADIFGLVLNLEKLGLDLVLGEKTIGTLLKYEDEKFKLDINAMFRQIYLAQFLKVPYTIEDGQIVITYQNPDQKTVKELIAHLDIGAIVIAIFDKDIDLIDTALAGVESIYFLDILALFMDTSIAGLDHILDGKTIGTLFFYEDGKFYLDLPSFLGDLYLADILGVSYEIIDGRFTLAADDDSTLLYRMLAPISLSVFVNHLLENKGDIVGALYGGLSVLSFLDIVALFVKDLSSFGLEEVLSHKTIGDLVAYENGKFSITVRSFLADVYLAAILEVPHHFEDGQIVIEFADPANKTWKEIIAHISLGGLTEAVLDGDYGQVLHEIFAPIYLSDLLLTFFGNDLGRDLAEAFADLTLGDLVSVENGNPVIHAGLILVSVELGNTIKDILNGTTSVQGFVRLALGIGAGAYLVLTKGQEVLDREINDVLEQAGIENRYLTALFAGKRFSDLVSFEDGFSLDLLGFVADMAFTDMLGFVGLADHAALNAIFTGKVVSDLISKVNGKIHFDPLGFVETIGWRDILSIFVDLGDGALSRIIGDKAIGDLVYEEDGTLHFDPIGFIGDIAFADIIDLFGVEIAALDAIFGSKTISDLVYMEDGKVAFDLLGFVGSIYFKDIVSIFADLGDGALSRIIGDKAIGDLVYKEDGTLHFDPIGFIGDIAFADIIDLFGVEIAALDAIFGDKTISDLVYMEDGEVAFDLLGFVGSIYFKDIVSIFADLGDSALSRIIGDKVIGDLVFEEDGTLHFDPIGFIGDIAFADIIDIFGVEIAALDAIFDDKTIGDVLKYDDNGQLQVDWYGFVASIVILDLVELFVTNEYLSRILSDKTIGTLVSYSDGNFAFHPLDFVGDIQLVDLLGLFGMASESVRALFDHRSIGDLIREEDGKLVFDWLGFIGDIYFTEILALFNLDNGELHEIFAGKRIGDLLYYADEELQLAWVEFIGDIRFVSLYNATGLQYDALLNLFGEKTIGSLLYYRDGVLVCDWVTFISDITINSLFGLFLDVQGSEIGALFDGLTLGDLVFEEDGTLHFDPVGFIGDIAFVDIIDLFGVEIAALDAILGSKTISDLVYMEDGKVAFDLLGFVGSIYFKDIVSIFADLGDGALSRIIGDKVIGDLVFEEDGTLHFDPIGFIRDILWADLLALVLNPDAHSIDELLADRTIGDLFSYEDGVLAFHVYDFVKDMVINDVLNSLLAFLGTDLVALDLADVFAGLAVSDVVSMTDGSLAVDAEAVLGGLDLGAAVADIFDATLTVRDI
ncbi:MAG: hypothetical protein WDA00_02450, partial [Eubacteriales bacterium]